MHRHVVPIRMCPICGLVYIRYENYIEDEDAFNKYNKQSEGFSKQYKIDAQVILDNSLQLLNNSETALVQITNKLKDIISQG